jgi:hypothetical protein
MSAASLEGYYSAVLRVLSDAERNCLLLLTSEMRQEMTEALSAWPADEPRKLAQDLLWKRLGEDSHRLVTRDDKPVCAVDTCQGPGCPEALALAGERGRKRPDVLIVPPNCSSCTGFQQACEVVDLWHYPVSKFQKRCQEGESREPETGQEGEPEPRKWNKSVMAREVLRPLFRFASKVTIVDRYIGRSVVPYPPSRNDWHRRPRPSPRTKIKYLRSLEWIYRLFLDETREVHQPAFEIYCGLEDIRLEPATVDEPYWLAAYLTAKYAGFDPSRPIQKQRFALTTFPGTECHFDLEASYAKSRVPVVMHVRRETPHTRRELPHARSICTDQFGIWFDPGFDFLERDEANAEQSDRNVRNLHLTRVRRLDWTLGTLNDAGWNDEKREGSKLLEWCRSYGVYQERKPFTRL